jgi:hypothetical protein
MLFGSFGFTIDMHICQGKVKAVSVMGEAPKCLNMEVGNFCKPTDAFTTIAKTKCCSNASFHSEFSVATEMEFSSELPNLVLGINPYFLVAAEIPFQKKEQTDSYHSPPDSWQGKTMLILHQTFLI